MSEVSGYLKLLKQIPNCGLEQVLAHEFFIQLAEKSRGVFWIRSADYKQQIYVSPAYEKIWGRSCQSLYERPNEWSDFLYPEDRVRMENEIRERDEKALPAVEYNAKYRIMRPNGEIRWIRDQGFPIYAKHNECIGFAGIAEDITNDIKYAENLKVAKEQAELANQAKTEFIANMSHDLRTPISGIIGTARMLKKLISEPNLQLLLDGLYSSSSTLLLLVENILDYSQHEHGTIKPRLEKVDLEALIREITHIYRDRTDEKGINLIVDYADGAPRFITSDIRYLNRIMLNLLGNAVKFTQQGEILVKVAPTSNGVTIIVHDTGIGIPSDKLGSIFERFTRVEPSDQSKYKGNGLGLAIVKQFVEALGGNIHAQSKLNEGSLFTVNFKVQEE